MTKAEIISLLDKMDLAPDMDEFEVFKQIEKIGYDNSKIEVFEGSSKICLVFKDTNFVVKWSYCNSWKNEIEIDESIREYEIYTHAVEENLDFFFPKTEILGKWNNVTVIIQDKIDYAASECPYIKNMYYKCIAKTVTNKIFKKMEDGFQLGTIYDRRLDVVWGKLVISLYGKQVAKKLCEFIQKYNINDLHSENIGYKNDRPMILDFAGYYRNN